MGVISDAIAAELERRAGRIEVEAVTPSPLEAGDRFVAKVEVPASMEVDLEPEGPLDPLPRTHTVRKGETLSLIAGKYETTWQELASINELDDPNLIQPGQVLALTPEENDGATLTSVTVPIEAEVKWKVTMRDPAGEAQSGRDFILETSAPASRGDINEHTMTALLAPTIVSLTEPPKQRPTEWLIETEVTLTARADKVPELQQLGEGPQEFTPNDLAGLPVTVAPLAVPSVLVAFSETRYNTTSNKARLVIVPTNVPVEQAEGRVQDVEGLFKTLNDVQAVIERLKGLARVAGWVTGLSIGLDKIMQTVRAHPIGSKHKLVFKRLNEARDLGKVEPDWRHRRGWDDHGAEDDIDSLLMVSVDQRLDLFESKDFKGKRVEIDPSPSQFWIGIPDFHNVRQAEPSDAKVTSSVTDFSDEAHSFRFRSRG